jgi:hypothetical protein
MQSVKPSSGTRDAPLELPAERLVIGGKGSDDAVWQVRLRTHRAHGGSHLRASSVGVGA